MTGIYLLLGTNLGNKVKNLEKAIELMVANKIAIRRESSIYETAAWGIEDQPSFLNQVVEIETSKTPEKLLELLQGIEQKMGRVREIKWGERLIDIDILYYGDMILDHNDLKIPHPEIQNRRFTLAPLAEIASCFKHPALGENHLDLLDACQDNLKVSKLENVY